MKYLITTIAALVLVGCGSSINDAAGSGDLEAVKKHLAAGADVNAKSDWNSSVLHDAAMNGQAEVVELLITAGADVNAKNNSGYTPLHESSDFSFANNAEKVMELLISAGADVNAKDNEGFIPFALRRNQKCCCHADCFWFGSKHKGAKWINSITCKGASLC